MREHTRDLILALAAGILGVVFVMMLTACSQRVSLSPSPVDPCEMSLHEINMIHREHIRGFRGDCADWTFHMYLMTQLDCAFFIKTSLSGVEFDHLALGILTHEGLFVSDVNKSGIVHINNAGYRNKYEVFDGEDFVPARIVVEQGK